MQSSGADGGGFRGQWQALPGWLRGALSAAVALIVFAAALLGATAASHHGRGAASASSTTSSSTDTTDTTLPLLALGTSTTSPTTSTSTTSTSSTTTTTRPPTTTTEAPTTTAPARSTTTLRPVPEPFCAASMSNPVPPEPKGTATSTDTVQVSSNLARAQVAVTAHYATGPSTTGAATDARGSASVPLTFDRTQAPRGFAVVVDVSVGSGQAVCQTSFTAQ